MTRTCTNKDCQRREVLRRTRNAKNYEHLSKNISTRYFPGQINTQQKEILLVFNNTRHSWENVDTTLEMNDNHWGIHSLNNQNCNVHMKFCKLSTVHRESLDWRSSVFNHNIGLDLSAIESVIPSVSTQQLACCSLCDTPWAFLSLFIQVKTWSLRYAVKSSMYSEAEAIFKIVAAEILGLM